MGILIFISILDLLSIYNFLDIFGVEFYIIWCMLSVVSILNSFNYGIFEILVHLIPDDLIEHKKLNLKKGEVYKQYKSGN